MPGNPAADRLHERAWFEAGPEDDERRLSGVDYNALADGQPSLWCHWEVCWSGCCLTFSGAEKFYGSTQWMTYLIDHFLKPGAHASTSGLGSFEQFTFDHRLDGLVVASRRSDRRMTMVRVTDSVVVEEVMQPGDVRLEERERLA